MRLLKVDSNAYIAKDSAEDTSWELSLSHNLSTNHRLLLRGTKLAASRITSLSSILLCPDLSICY